MNTGPAMSFVIPRSVPVVFPAPDLVVGRCELYYKEDDHLKETPEKSVHLVFVSEYPEVQWIFEERLSLTMDPAPPVAYKRFPLPTEETMADGPREPHASADYRYGIESFYLEGLNAQGIVTQWKETPWLPRRDFWLGGTDDDPEGRQPLSDDSISLYKRVAKAWRWSRFRRNATGRKIIISPRRQREAVGEASLVLFGRVRLGSVSEERPGLGSSATVA